MSDYPRSSTPTLPTKPKVTTTDANYSAASANFSTSSAPLPSPSSTQPSNSYFTAHRHRSSSLLPQSHTQGPTSQPQPQQLFAQSQQTTQGQQYGHPPYPTGNEKGFCLVAEAAKRAQMAVLMRDMGEVAL
jgi:hypothetical protein